MDLALTLAKDWPNLSPSGTLIRTGFQTRGRGRHHGRSWQSEKSTGFLTTTILRPLPGANEPISLRVALAAARLLEEVFELAVEIKWPNDLLFRGRKLAGILIERVRPDLVLVGFGLNVLGAAPGNLAPTGNQASTENAPLADSRARPGNQEPARTRAPQPSADTRPLEPISVREAAAEAGAEPPDPELQRLCSPYLQRLFVSLDDSSWKSSVEFRLAYKKRRVHVGAEDYGPGVQGLLQGINAQGFVRILTDSGTFIELSSGSLRLQ